MQETITIEKQYPYSVDEVWNALTDAESLGEWLMKNNFEPRIGHVFQFSYVMDGKRVIIDCKVLEVKRPSKLSYTWTLDPIQKAGADLGGADTIVTWSLEAASGGTKLLLEHSGFDSEKDEQIFNALSGGWKQKLDEVLPASIEKRQSVAA